jgi:hypothetical protein
MVQAHAPHLSEVRERDLRLAFVRVVFAIVVQVGLSHLLEASPVLAQHVRLQLVWVEGVDDADAVRRTRIQKSTDPIAMRGLLALLLTVELAQAGILVLDHLDPQNILHDLGGQQRMARLLLHVGTQSGGR